MTSSGLALDSGVAGHPAEITAEVAARLLVFAESADEQRAIENIVRLTVSPPDLRVLRQLIDPLRTLRRLDDSAFAAAVGYLERNKDNDALISCWHEKAFPFPPTLLRLFNVSGDGLDCHVTFALRLVELGQRWPDPRHFSGHMYYKHLVAYRDVCRAFWLSRRTNQPSSGSPAPLFEPVAAVAKSLSSHPDDLALLREFAEQGTRSPLRGNYGRIKYEYTAALLDGDLSFGDARPRGPLSRGGHQPLGTPIQIETSTCEALTTSDLIQSAKVSPVYLDDDGTSCSIEFPGGATTKDRQRILQRAANGFARTNVKTAADMAMLSRVTYRDYLAFAAEHLDPPKHALAWLSAFPGIDVTRPLALRASAKRTARNDQILLDPTQHLIEYNVLRRSDRLDPAQYETAGRMQLPLPPGVGKGLLEIIDKEDQAQQMGSADRVAERFSRSHPGLTPTLNRLRASARFFLAPLEFSELAFCAVSGRVTPALKGISAYYPHVCRDIVGHFCKAYGSLTRDLGLESWGSVKVPPSCQEQIFCRPSPGIESIQMLLGRLADLYEARCAEIKNLGRLSKPEDLIHALQAHEIACYIVQQLAVGLRPIGKLATVIVVPDLLIAMIRDKSSMFASERSYSPITRTHRRLIDCSAQNRSALQRSLRWSGRELVFDEEIFSLAVELRCAGCREPVFGSRMTNDYFHNRSCIAAEVRDLARQPNWIRHVAIAHLAGCAPQWMLDELFGHTRIGRQPFGRWSTAGGSHFQHLRDCLERLLDQNVDPRLFTSLPVPF